jgi:signal transduction histidine kinase
MASVLGITGTFLYLFFSRSLNRQLNRELMILAQAAVPSLDTVLTEGSHDLVKDLPWRHFFSKREQSIEWFNPDGQLLAKEGTVFSQLPLLKEISPFSIEEGSPLFQQTDKVRTVTIAVYTHSPDGKTLKLKGYIRAGESLVTIQSTLNHLRLGLWSGGFTALFFICISSIYLTKQAFQPTLQSFHQLKQFTADASHELRNPLIKISLATETLLANKKEEFTNPVEIKKLKIIKSSSEQMKRLLEDLFFLARTDALPGLSPTEMASIFIDEILQPLVEHFKALAQTKGIVFEARILNGLSVKGDSSQLNRLFSNLLENAIKYTDSGGKVSLSLVKHKQRAVISVEDTGIGIRREYLPYVFQRFWRTERARRKKIEGSGLGLAIAQVIAQQHGGKITVNSQVGKGSCFRIYLPLA